MTIATNLGSRGKNVIPERLRRVLGWIEGEDLVLQLEDGELVVTTRNQLRKWACDLVRNLVPDDVDLADELIKERWQAAAVIGYAVDGTASRGVRPRLIGATDKANG